MQRLRSIGNVSGLVDSADGSLDAKYEYGAFGEPLRVGGTAIADDNPFRFSTKYLDTESGLIYYGFRYYSPSLGRFLNRDPLGEEGGQNLTANYTDEDRLEKAKSDRFPGPASSQLLPYQHLETPNISRKPSDPLGQLLGRHGVFVEPPAEFLLIDSNPFDGKGIRGLPAQFPRHRVRWIGRAR